MTPTITAETHADLFHKALAVRTQLGLFQTEAALHDTRAELSRAHSRALEASLPPLEMQLLAALDAPSGARFNWQTFGFDVPEPTGERGPELVGR